MSKIKETRNRGKLYPSLRPVGSRNSYSVRARDPGEIVTDRDTALRQEGMGHRQFIGQTEPKASRQKKRWWILWGSAFHGKIKAKSGFSCKGNREEPTQYFCLNLTNVFIVLIG